MSSMITILLFRGVCQSLIGTVQRRFDYENIKKFFSKRCQSLIGTVQLGELERIRKSNEYVSIPHRYGTTGLKTFIFVVAAMCQSLIGTVQLVMKISKNFIIKGIACQSLIGTVQQMANLSNENCTKRCVSIPHRYGTTTDFTVFHMKYITIFSDKFNCFSKKKSVSLQNETPRKPPFFGICSFLCLIP